MNSRVESKWVGWQKQWKWLFLGIVAVFVLFVLPFCFDTPRLMHIYISTISMIGVAAGLRLIMLTQRFSMGQAAFMGIGAYMSAVLATRYDVDPLLGLLIGGISATIVAIFFGYISLRLSGMYFAMVTLALGEILVRLYLWWDSVTGGYMGLARLSGYHIDVFGMEVTFGLIDLRPYYFLICFITFLAMLVYWRLEYSRIGIALRSTGQNDVLAQHLGVNVTRYRVLAFAIPAFFTGVVGAFTAHYLHTVDPSQFGISASFNPILVCILGGIHLFAGPVIGALAMTGITEGISNTKDLHPIILGGILILIMIFLPNGLVSLPEKMKGVLKTLKRKNPFTTEVESISLD